MHAEIPRTGIVTRYSWHEATYAALRLAEVAQLAGSDVGLYSFGQSLQIGSPWDGRACRGPFGPWLETVDQVVVTHMLTEEQVRGIQSQRKRVILLPVWHELDMADVAAVQQADILLSASRAQHLWMQRQLGRASRLATWDCGWPLTHKQHIGSRPLRVLWPLYDGNARRVPLSCCTVWRRAAEAHPQVTFTILVNSATLSGPFRRRLQRMASLSNIHIQRATSWTARQLAFLRHDLTFWPTSGESFGLTGIYSTACGTPVLTFGCPPMSDLLEHGQGWELRATIGMSEDQLPSVASSDENIRQLAKGLAKLLDNPNLVWDKQRTVLQGQPERRTLFEQTVRRALLLPTRPGA